MYQYLKSFEIDLKLWDHCIEKSKNGTVYAYSWFLTLVAEEWEGIVNQDNSGNYIQVFPIPVKTKFCLKYMYNPVFCNELGLISIREIEYEDLEQIHNLLRKRFTLISNYHLNLVNSKDFNFQFFDFQIRKVLFYHIDISKDYSKIYSTFSERRKRSIAKSYTHELFIEESVQIDSLITLFKENIEHKIYGGVKKQQYNQLRSLFIESYQKGRGKLFIVRNKEEQIISGCFILLFKNKIIQFFNASSNEGRRLNSDSFLMDNIIRKYSKKYTIFDLTSESSHGVNTFKESFNSYKYINISISQNLLPYPFKKMKEIRNRVLSFYFKPKNLRL
jgi:hypothetical protein